MCIQISRVVEVKIREHVTASTGKGLVLKPRTVSKLALTLAQLERWRDLEAWRALLLLMTACVEEMDQEHVSGDSCGDSMGILKKFWKIFLLVFVHFCLSICM